MQDYVQVPILMLRKLPFITSRQDIASMLVSRELKHVNLDFFSFLQWINIISFSFYLSRYITVVAPQANSNEPIQKQANGCWDETDNTKQQDFLIYLCPHKETSSYDTCCEEWLYCRCSLGHWYACLECLLSMMA